MPTDRLTRLADDNGYELRVVGIRGYTLAAYVCSYDDGMTVITRAGSVIAPTSHRQRVTVRTFDADEILLDAAEADNFADALWLLVSNIVRRRIALAKR